MAAHMHACHEGWGEDEVGYEVPERVREQDKQLVGVWDSMVDICI